MAPKKSNTASKPAAKAAAPAKASKAPAKAASKPAPPKKGSASKPAPKKESGAAGVIVKNLEFEGMCHETVTDIFKSSGKISEIRLRHGKYVLIFFDSMTAAQRATDMGGKVVKGNKISVQMLKKAKPTQPRAEYCTTVYAGNLPGGTTKRQLALHFKKHGKVDKVRLFKAKRCAFIYFADNAAARAAFGSAATPFVHGKDITKGEFPLAMQTKLTLAYSLRTLENDRKVAARRAARAPPFVQARRQEKSEARKKRKEAKKAAAAAAAAKAPAKPELPKKAPAKKSTGKK